MVQESDEVTIPQEWIDAMDKVKKGNLVSIAVAINLMDAMLATGRFTDDEAKNMALLYLDKTVVGGG